MTRVSIIEQTKKYVVVRISRHLAGRLGLSKNQLTEDEAFKILSRGLKEAKKGATRRLVSLRDFR